MMTVSTDPAAHGAVLFYATDCYLKFNRLTYEQCAEAVNVAGEASMGYPLFNRDKDGKFPQFDVPHFGKKSSVFCAAIMGAWLVWQQCVLRDNPLPDNSILQAAKDGLFLFDKKTLSEYWIKQIQRGLFPDTEVPEILK